MWDYKFAPEKWFTLHVALSFALKYDFDVTCSRAVKQSILIGSLTNRKPEEGGNTVKNNVISSALCCSCSGNNARASLKVSVEHAS